MSTPPTTPINAGDSPAGQVGGALGLKSGTKLGKYEIVGRLGLGGMALVYKGYDPLLDRFVAIKQIASHLAADPRFMERFRKEAQILARLGNEQASVVQIYELIEDARGLFIVMEYVEGQTLDVLIARQRGPMPVQLALEVLWHLAVGLRAVHERGIIHRDIKPANVLVGVNHRCKITDFGVAARTGGRTSMTLGTTKYMAPELFGGDEVDGRVDVYSLGCIAYEMLCGPDKFQQIFREVVKDERAESLRWMKWHTNRELMAPLLSQVNPQVPEVLAKIVAKMMAKEPAQRFTSAEHLLEILKRHFTQTGQVKKAIGKQAARAAKAHAVDPNERRPEPIPEYPAEGAVAAVPVVPVVPVGPGTTRLPRRKMTRRQRLVVLSSLLGLILIGLGAMWVVRARQASGLNGRAAAIYDRARDAWLKADYASARHSLRLLLADESLIKEADATIRKAESDLETMPSEDPARAPLEKQIADARAVKAAVPLNAALAAVHPPQGQPGSTWGQWARARLTWLDGKQALAEATELSRSLWVTRWTPEVTAMANDKEHPDRWRTWAEETQARVDAAWARAHEADKAMADANVLPEKERGAFATELEYQKGFLSKTKEALDMMVAGYKKMDRGRIEGSKQPLDDALTILPRENLSPEYGYRRTLMKEYDHQRALETAKAAVDAGRAQDAEALYRELLKDWPNDRTAQDWLLVQSEAKTLADARARIDAAGDAVRKIEAMTDFLRKWPNDPKAEEYRTKIAQNEGSRAFASGLQALQNNQVPVAQMWFARAIQKDPSLKRQVDAELAKIKDRDDYSAKLASAEQALAVGEIDLAVTAFREAMELSKSAIKDPRDQQAAADRINEKIREARLSQALSQAAEAFGGDDLAKADKIDALARAQDAFTRARRHVKPGDDSTLASIDTKVEEIQVRRQYKQQLKAADDLLAASKFMEARKNYQALLAWAGDLKRALEAAPVSTPAPAPPWNPRRGPRPPTPTPAPAPSFSTLPKVPSSLINTIETTAQARLKDVDYARFLYDARIDVDQKKWQTAKQFADMARNVKDTTEVRLLIEQIDDALKRAGGG